MLPFFQLCSFMGDEYFIIENLIKIEHVKHLQGIAAILSGAVRCLDCACRNRCLHSFEIRR